MTTFYNELLLIRSVGLDIRVKLSICYSKQAYFHIYFRIQFSKTFIYIIFANLDFNLDNIQVEVEESTATTSYPLYTLSVFGP